MKKTLVLLAIAASFGLSACAQTATDLPPGKYESTSKSTDANGTSYKTDSTTKVTEDSYGNKKAVVEQKTSTDPKGLFNKSTTKSKTVETN